MITFKQLSFVIAIAASISLAGCGAMTANKRRNAIQRVLDQNARVTDNATSVAQIVSRMRAIDCSNCPSDFRQAYVTHIHAWEMLASVETQAKQYGTNYFSGEAMIESFIRGAMGDPFGKAQEAIAAKNQLQQSYQYATNQIKLTLNRVEEIAVGYGASLPAQTNQ